MVYLNEDERLDYLLAENLRIIQSPNVFAFSLDAVLLARFAYIPIQKGKILDLCTGNAVVPLLMSSYTKATITGVEIQERLYDMAKRSVEYNKLEDKISLIHGDLKDMTGILGYHKFDAVTCNPPYFSTPPKSEKNENEHYAIARHELFCTLEDVIKACSQLVRQKGKVSIVHRPDRLTDIITIMRQYSLEPKRIQFVHPKEGKEAHTVLVEGVRDGKAGLKVLKPIIVYDEFQEYTRDIKEILYREEQ